MSFGGDTAGDEKIRGARGERRAQRRRRLFQDDRPRGHPRAASSLPNEELSVVRRAHRHHRRDARERSSSAPRIRSGSSSSSRNGSRPIRSCSQVVGVVAASRHQLLEHEMRPHLYTALRPGVPVGDASAHAHRRRVSRRRGGDAARAPARAPRHRCRRADHVARNAADVPRPQLLLWTLRAGANTFLTFGAHRALHVGDRHLRRQGVCRRAPDARDRHPPRPRRHAAQRRREWCCGTACVLAVAGLALGLLLSVARRRRDSRSALRRQPLRRARRASAPRSCSAPPRSSRAGCPARRATRIAATMAMRAMTDLQHEGHGAHESGSPNLQVPKSVSHSARSAVSRIDRRRPTRRAECGDEGGD